MNDAVKAILGSQLRHWLLLLLGAGLSRHIVPQEVVDAISNMSGLETIAFVSALGVMLWGAYVRLMSKTKQKIALNMPKGSSQSELNEAASKQSLASIVKVQPKNVAVVILALLLPCFVMGCANT